MDWDLILSVAKEVAVTEENPSRAKVANRLGLVHSTLNKRAKVDGMIDELDAVLGRDSTAEPGKLERHPDGSATIISEPVESSPWTPESLLKAHGFAPDEWEVVRARANRWGDPEEPRHQLRVDVVPVAGIIKFPDPSEWTPPPKPKKARTDVVRTAVICGDHHAPHEDRTLHRLFLARLADRLPDEGILVGDLLDFATISRHRERDGWCQPVNEGLRAAFAILRDYREASPDTRWRMIRGNHDARLEHAVLDNVKGLHRITAADDDVPALSLRRLLHLDALGIEFVDEDWDRARVPITAKLTARHGPATSKAATDKLLSKYARSTIQGHTHRLSLKFRTEHTEDEDEPTITRLGGEVGCMAQIKDSLGYGSDEDWQQGFIEATLWPDGDFHLTPCTYIPGRLLTPERRYS